MHKVLLHRRMVLDLRWVPLVLDAYTFYLNFIRTNLLLHGSAESWRHHTLFPCSLSSRHKNGCRIPLFGLTDRRLLCRYPVSMRIARRKHPTAFHYTWCHQDFHRGRLLSRFLELLLKLLIGKLLGTKGKFERILLRVEERIVVGFLLWHGRLLRWTRHGTLLIHTRTAAKVPLFVIITILLIGILYIHVLLIAVLTIPLIFFAQITWILTIIRNIIWALIHG